jgi:hypothetical protein
VQYGWNGVCEGVSQTALASITHASPLTSHRYHVERFLREAIIPRLAPISREMCLNYISEKVLDLPKSY